MKTTAIENDKGNKTAKKQAVNKSAIRPAVPLKDAGSYRKYRAASCEALSHYQLLKIH